jgi:chromosome segregation ATPase
MRLPAHRTRGLLAVAALATLVAAHASAQEARRSGDASARLQQAVMQLQNEKAQLAAENQRLKADVERLQAEADRLDKERGSLERRASAAETKASRLEAGGGAAGERLRSTEARLNEVVGKYRELAETLRQVEQERATLRQQAARDAAALASCSTNNVELAGIADEALTRYVKKGCFGALAQAEPFTGIQRARIENAVAESRARIATLSVPPAAPEPDEKSK